MPHFGHLPGFADLISGCIGQTYSAALGAALPVEPGSDELEPSALEGAGAALSGAVGLAG